MDELEANNLATLGHEPVETDVRAVWRTAGVLAGVVIATFVLIIGLMKGFAASEGKPATNFAASNHRSSDKQLTLQQLRVQERDLLSQYKWVDQANGNARIPIARAMEIISESGLPAALQEFGTPEAVPAHGSSPPGNPSANVDGQEP